MFRFFSKQLTESSNHYIDWSRIGELLQSGSHRYSRDELLARGSIIGFTAVSAYLAAEFNNPDNTNCSNTTMAMAGGMLGFVLSHVVVIYPLYQKRKALSAECERLATEIHFKITNNSLPISAECRANIENAVEQAFSLSLSDDKHGNASQTWGRRKRLLAEINEKLHPETFREDDWLVVASSSHLLGAR